MQFANCRVSIFATSSTRIIYVAYTAKLQVNKWCTANSVETVKEEELHGNFELEAEAELAQQL